MVRFLHAADLHLDSPLRGLERYDGAPVGAIRLAPRRALENLIALALEQRVDLVLIAGDLYDGDWRDYHTGLFFREQMRRLSDAGVPAVLISGNHDAASKITRSLSLPPGVELLPSRAPATLRLEALGVAVHGQSFAKEAVLDNLAAAYPAPVRGWLNLGLLHTGMEFEGEHARYAPCTLAELRRKEYDYWALGHIHQRQAVAPHVCYSGNVQGRHIREPGAKGVLLVEAEPGEPPRTEFHAVDVLRWETVAADVSAAPDTEACLSLLEAAVLAAAEPHGELPLALRLVLTGAAPAHEQLVAGAEAFENELRARISDWTSGRGWVEKVRLQTQPPHAPAQSSTPLGLIRRVASELLGGPSAAELQAELAELKHKLPAELRDGGGALPWDDHTWLQELLQQAEAELLDRVQRLRGGG